MHPHAMTHTRVLRRAALVILAASTPTIAGAAARAQSPTQRPAIPDRTRVQFDTAAILASARPDIEAANAAWLPGLRRHDAAMIAAAYADSGLFIAADGTVTRGRAAVAQLYAARFPHLRTIRGGGVVQDGLTVISATHIVEWGHAWIDQDAASGTGPPVRSGGAYLTVWDRGADGHWRITRNLTF